MKTLKMTFTSTRGEVLLSLKSSAGMLFGEVLAKLCIEVLYGLILSSMSF